ncbi:hypothetical protein ACYJ1Y_01085 [Natrialbaceae archaeon A-gly3]
MHEKTIGRPGTDRDPLEALVDVLTAATRYDLLLAVVPVAFAVALVVAYVAGVALYWALVPAAVVGILAVVDAVYLHPPVDQDRLDRSESIR